MYGIPKVQAAPSITWEGSKDRKEERVAINTQTIGNRKRCKTLRKNKKTNNYRKNKQSAGSGGTKVRGSKKTNAASKTK